ncbi:MAG TPA: hypothetical protein VND94_03145 [Terriglobia bacterium]|nr:hypothetical protein [Terriglobia bacterium]
MSDQLRPSDQSSETDDLGPPKQVFGTFGRAYRLSKRTRRILAMIEAVFVVTLIPWVYAVIVRADGWWKWTLVAFASTGLRFVMIKLVLVLSGTKGIDVPLSERKRRYARQLDAQGVIQALWLLPICLTGLIVLVTGDIVTGTKSLTKDLWLEAALISGFAVTVWLALTTQRFIRRWRQS